MPDIWTKVHEKSVVLFVGADDPVRPLGSYEFAIEFHVLVDRSAGGQSRPPLRVFMIAAAIFGWRLLLAFSEDLKNVALEVEGMVGGEGGGVVAGLHEKLE